jgi:hypothetical protein
VKLRLKLWGLFIRYYFDEVFYIFLPVSVILELSIILVLRIGALTNSYCYKAMQWSKKHIFFFRHRFLALDCCLIILLFFFSKVMFYFILFLFIYSHVHTLFGSFLPSYPAPSLSPLQLLT